MKNKIAIVTGANNGIGFETAVGMAQANHQVILACRSQQRAEKAKESILQRVPEASLEVMILDLSNRESVIEFAQLFKSKYRQLNVLINNAGILDYSGRKNNQGYELQFATNHLGHFLLTALLIDLFPDTAESRIVSLSSIAHKQGKIHFDDINCENQDTGAAYAQSKLACLMFADELNRRLKEANSQVVSLAVHPGGSDSGLFEDVSRIKYYMFKLLSPLITHSNKAAAQPSLYAALSNDVRGGDYYGPQGMMELKGKVGVARRTDYSKDTDVAEKLWSLSEEIMAHKFVVSNEKS